MKRITLFTIVLLLSGCASVPSPTPKPECAGAKLAGTDFEHWGRLGIEEAWAIAIVMEKVPVPVLNKIAKASLAAVNRGTVDALVVAVSSAASDVTGKNYALLILPITSLLADYGNPKLNKCDQELLVMLFSDLVMLSEKY